MFSGTEAHGIVPLSNHPRRAAGAVILILSILTVTAGCAAGIYHLLVFVSSLDSLGILLAAPIIIFVLGFFMSCVLFGGDD